MAMSDLSPKTTSRLCKLIITIVLLGIAAAAAGAGKGKISDRDASKADWEAWRRKFEDGYSKDRLAVLKIHDSVFLKPGQTAYLLGRRGAPSSFRWSLQTSEKTRLHVTFAAEPNGRLRAALMRSGRQFNALKVLKARRPYSVSAQIDLTGRVVGEGTGRPRYELKIYNQRHPAAQAFEGLDFFPWSAAHLIKAKYRPEAAPVPVILDTERGLRKRFYRHGLASFELAGQAIRMPLYTQSAERTGITSLFAPFTDETTGKETYGVGRYLDVPVSGFYPPQAMTLDFNRAYNPLCARSAHFNCPLVEFHIPVPVRAGEKYSKR